MLIVDGDGGVVCCEEINRKKCAKLIGAIA